MDKTKEIRRHELLLLPKEVILDQWRKATGASDDDTAKKSHVMIQEILDHEFPPAPSEIRSHQGHQSNS